MNVNPFSAMPKAYKVKQTIASVTANVPAALGHIYIISDGKVASANDVIAIIPTATYSETDDDRDYGATISMNPRNNTWFVVPHKTLNDYIVEYTIIYK